MKESRQQIRARKRREAKDTDHLTTRKEYFIETKRKSRSGVEYTVYQRVVDKVGLDKKKANENK